MPKNETLTLTGWKKRITAYCVDHMIEKSAGQIERMALKIHKRQQSMSEVLDFYAALRILGICSDTTARDAINNLERQAA